jgi:hypothetical protein
MRQDLIDPAPRHHVAAEEKADRVRLRYLSQRALISGHISFFATCFNDACDVA